MNDLIEGKRTDVSERNFKFFKISFGTFIPSCCYHVELIGLTFKQIHNYRKKTVQKSTETRSKDVIATALEISHTFIHSFDLLWIFDDVIQK